jgi:hypothetical protein
MRIEILDEAEQDLLDGFHFYNKQQAGLGAYFLEGLSSDIESLAVFGGVHRIVNGRYHRLLSKRFPFAVFYLMSGDTVFIRAVLDCRSDPTWIRSRLK